MEVTCHVPYLDKTRVFNSKHVLYIIRTAYFSEYLRYFNAEILFQCQQDIRWYNSSDTWHTLRSCNVRWTHKPPKRILGMVNYIQRVK